MNNGRLTIKLDQIVSKSLPSDNVDNNRISFFNLNCSITITVIELPVNFSFSSSNNTIKGLNHFI